MGKAGHGAKQHDFSDNAIEIFLATLGKIKKEFKNWQIEFEDYILGEPSLNITGIYTSGESINKIPSACFVTLDIRTTPKLHGKLLELLKKTVGEEIITSFLKNPIEPIYISSNNEVVKKMKKFFPKLSITTSLGSTDQVFFAQHGIEAVVLGPGVKEVIHSANEYIPLE